MKKLFVLFGGFALTLSAGMNNEIAACASKNGDLDRLQCYDNLAKRHKLSKPIVAKTNNTDKGKWRVSTEKNPIDDTTTATAMLIADEGQSKWRKPIFLMVRCQSDETDLYIGWGDYLGSTARVTTRLGNAEATTTNWLLSTNKKASFYPKSPILFLRELVKSNNFIAQVTPYNESPSTAVFDTSGAIQALKTVAETCHWEFSPVADRTKLNTRSRCENNGGTWEWNGSVNKWECL